MYMDPQPTTVSGITWYVHHAIKGDGLSSRSLSPIAPKTNYIKRNIIHYPLHMHTHFCVVLYR